ncbi:MAG: hypothetical protein QW548_02645 [Candidatus Aenigmatarchaeota archaeon]
MSSGVKLAAIIGLLIGLAASFVAIAIAPNGSSIAAAGCITPNASASATATEAGRLVAGLLAANEIDATLLAVSDESGLYKVTVKDAAGTASDFYVTKDGRMLFQVGIIGVNETIARLNARREFFECLAARGLRFYGSTETNATLLQLQILGGTRFVDRIYVPCEGIHAQACADANITEVPTFALDNASWAGVKTLDWLINLTGCQMA